jgi:arginine deiminase
MKSGQKINVTSEIGELEAVVLHSPGPEVENMTPETAQRALYSDILNLSVASREYSQLYGVLKKVSTTYQVKNLLEDILRNEKTKDTFILKICHGEKDREIVDFLHLQTSDQLAKIVIEGVPMNKDSLTRFLSKERYAMPPLHNFFFTRDSAVAINNRMLIARMANKIRERESIIMESIFDAHPIFDTRTINPQNQNNFNAAATIEGGDVLVARQDILIIGMGARTNSQGIDFIIERYKEKKQTRHIIVQELPFKPESFIHLDMVFTFLSTSECMVYEPIILDPSSFSTVHIFIDNGVVKSIRYVDNILIALRSLGMDIKPIICGGRKDIVFQDREQWHSGANFFAFAPGKVVGYERNLYTIEELDNHGFEVIKAQDIVENRIDLKKVSKCVVTLEGSELPRGGGGARCMTMPLCRKDVKFN